MIKLALLDPAISDSLAYGVGGAGLGAVLAALTAAGPQFIDSPYGAKKVSKVIPKKVVPHPVYVDEDMAKRLAGKGIMVRKYDAPKDPVAGDETAAMDPMQKLATWPFDSAGATTDVGNSILGGAKKILPFAAGLGALGGTYYGVNKLIANRTKDKEKAQYIAKRRELNALLAALNNAEEQVAPGMPKVAFEISDALPWLIGVPFLAGGALAFGDGYDAAVARNPNIKAQGELDKFYADLPDTPKVQLTPVLRPKPKVKPRLENKGPENDPLGKVAAVVKTAGFNFSGLSKLFTKPGLANDAVSVAGGAASLPLAIHLSENIDDPTYKLAERALMPMGVAGMLNRRVTGNMPVSKALKWGTMGELGLFGGLRGLDAMTNRNPKAIETQADAVRSGMRNLGIGAGVIGGLGLGGMYLGQQHSSREATRARRAQSRQLKKILETVNTRHGIPTRPGDVDGDGDVDDDDRALAAAAGVTAKTDKD